MTIASLSHEAEQLTRRLKEQQDSIVWYQASTAVIAAVITAIIIISFIDITFIV